MIGNRDLKASVRQSPAHLISKRIDVPHNIAEGKGHVGERDIHGVAACHIGNRHLNIRGGTYSLRNIGNAVRHIRIFSADDTLRAQSLRDDAARAEAAAALSPEAYVASLRQELIPEPLGPANLARAAQLTQRCNQFNMRGTRHTAAELAGKRGWVYRLRDRFGDLGAIGVVVLEGDFIETWALSCRALNRGVERLILAHLKAQGPIRGEYVPTPRNGRCATIYQENGVPTHEA